MTCHFVGLGYLVMVRTDAFVQTSQPPHLRAKEVAIPRPRPTDDLTSVNCVFAFEGLSLITYNQECEDITCLEIKSLALAE